MFQRMKLPSVFKNKETKNQEWQWPLCIHPKTQSFRAEDNIFKAVNSIYIDSFCENESWFTNSSSEGSASFSGTESNYEEMISNGLDDSVELIVRGVKLSERLFFEPEDTKSILDAEIEVKKGKEEEEEDEDDNGELFKESVVLAMESEDPYLDFKKSMEEMVETHGMKDWESLEELLEWYLKMNEKMSHGFIVGAFIDLMIEFVTFSDHQEQEQEEDCCFRSASSSYMSPPPLLSPVVQFK